MKNKPAMTAQDFKDEIRKDDQLRDKKLRKLLKSLKK